jgi:drug/metabolite transporter (DMT)-like permease
MSVLWAIIFAFINSIISSFGAMFLKFSASKIELSVVGLLKNRWFILGCVFYVIGTLFGIVALKWGDLSLVFPIVGLSYLWTFLLGVICLKENSNWKKILGVIAVVIGVTLVAITG